MTNYVPVPIDQAMGKLPSTMLARRLAGKSINRNFADGVQDSFPMLSIRGKVFRARISGEEIPFIDPQTRAPVPFIDVIMVNAAPNMAKTFYARGFEEGDMNPPDCWSMDGVRPDASVAQKMSLTCGTCKMNEFGSRTTPSGKAAKACADVRRMAVMMPHEVGKEPPRIFLLRVPQSSLKNLKGYSQLLERYNMDTNSCITRLAFDYNEAFPKLLFNFVAPLDDQTYDRVDQLADSDTVHKMLASPDFAPSPSLPPTQADSVATRVQQTGPVLATDVIDPETGEVMEEAQRSLSQQPVSSVQKMPPVEQTFYTDKPVSPATEAKVNNIRQLKNGQWVDMDTGEFVEAPKPPEPQPEPEPVRNLKQLKTGQWIDMDTMEFVDPPKAEVQMDPETRKLANGSFYNFKLDAFVTGPEVGAPAVTETKPEPKAEPVKRTRAPNKPKAEPKQEAKPEPEQAKAVEVKAQEEKGNGADPNAEEDDLPEDMEEALDALLPQV